MRQMARVWNLDDKDYSEKFKERLITIPAKKFIVMEPSEADSFLRAFTSIIRDTENKDVVPKMLKKELFKTKDKNPLNVPPPKFQCMIDAKLFPTQKAYDDHVKENHMDLIVDKESRDAFEEEEATI